MPNPIDAVGRAVVRFMRRLVTARWVPWVTVGVLLLTSTLTVSRGLDAGLLGADVAWWIVAGLLASAAASTAVAVAGLVIVRRSRHNGYGSTDPCVAGAVILRFSGAWPTS